MIYFSVRGETSWQYGQTSSSITYCNYRTHFRNTNPLFSSLNPDDKWFDLTLVHRIMNTVHSSFTFIMQLFNRGELWCLAYSCSERHIYGLLFSVGGSVPSHSACSEGTTSISSWRCIVMGPTRRSEVNQRQSSWLTVRSALTLYFNNFFPTFWAT